MFIYLFIILKLERIEKLENCLDIFIYYIKIGELFGYIIFKYNYLDIFWIYLYILFGYVYLFIYYIKSGEDWKIGGLFGYVYSFIYYIKIGKNWKN